MIGTLALLVMAQTQQWPQHSMDRPRPPVVNPGPERPPVPAPSDAIVLFDGSNLSQGESQERGNSGVFLMGIYELQVLDSYQNDTYPDGQAGAIYGENPPLVNAT